MAIECRFCGTRNPPGTQFCVNPDCRAYLGWEQPDAGHEHAQQAGPVGPAADGPEAAGAVTLSESALAVEPGQTVSTTATVYNGGSQVEQFDVAVVGPAGGWASVEPASLRIFPGDHAETVIRISPPREIYTPAGQSWFTVRAMS